MTTLSEQISVISLEKPSIFMNGMTHQPAFSDFDSLTKALQYAMKQKWCTVLNHDTLKRATWWKSECIWTDGPFGRKIDNPSAHLSTPQNA